MKTNYIYQLSIVGLGNYLLGDDGAGIQLIINLQHKKIPRDIKLIQAGTAPINFLEEISLSRRIIAVDAIRGGQEAGTIYRLTVRDIKRDRNIDSHGLSFLDVIEIARTLNGYPLTTIMFGIEPASIKPQTALSPPVAKAVARLSQMLWRSYIAPEFGSD